jgi:hypothetical protein
MHHENCLDNKSHFANEENFSLNKTQVAAKIKPGLGK